LKEPFELIGNKNLENFLLLWTGIWAFSMGFRISYELIVRSTVTVTGLLWFDWIPLTVLGFLATWTFIVRFTRSFFGGNREVSEWVSEVLKKKREC
jgi:hypothetical protein